MLTNDSLKGIAKALSSSYPYTDKEIYNVILQVRSIDLATRVIHYCTDMALRLDYGVYCYLKYKDDKKG